jgi:ribulose-5-phosphate 4-epimerase/fuculose-1-phosphate aldolase
MDIETAHDRAAADLHRQARVDLAAVYRLLAHQGWGDVIFNHAAMRCPSNPRNFLIKRHELLYTEVTASNLVEVSMDADLDERAGVNRPGFTLHSGVLRGRPDVNCSVHVHPDEGVAISALKHGLRPVSQSAMRFYNRIGYHDYEGLTDSFDERERIVAALGQNRALVMRHHGVTTVGATAREAFSLMKEFVRAARIQLMMDQSRQEVLEIAPHICEHVAAQYEQHDRGRASAEWPAYLRLLDGIDRSYRD